MITGKTIIICMAAGRGRKHAFRLFKESSARLHPQLKLKAGSGCQGIRKLHKESEVPHRRGKKRPLTAEEKACNRSGSRERVLAEHVIRKLKIFRILAERCRNGRKRFGLSVNLIAAVPNYEVTA